MIIGIIGVIWEAAVKYLALLWLRLRKTEQIGLQALLLDRVAHFYLIVLDSLNIKQCAQLLKIFKNMECRILYLIYIRNTVFLKFVSVGSFIF